MSRFTCKTAVRHACLTLFCDFISFIISVLPLLCITITWIIRAPITNVGVINVDDTLKIVFCQVSSSFICFEQQIFITQCREFEFVPVQFGIQKFHEIVNVCVAFRIHGPRLFSVLVPDLITVLIILSSGNGKISREIGPFYIIRPVPRRKRIQKVYTCPTRAKLFIFVPYRCTIPLVFNGPVDVSVTSCHPRASRVYPHGAFIRFAELCPAVRKNARQSARYSVFIRAVRTIRSVGALRFRFIRAIRTPDPQTLLFVFVRTVRTSATRHFIAMFHANNVLFTYFSHVRFTQFTGQFVGFAVRASILASFPFRICVFTTFTFSSFWTFFQGVFCYQIRQPCITLSRHVPIREVAAPYIVRTPCAVCISTPEALRFGAFVCNPPPCSSTSPRICVSSPFVRVVRCFYVRGGLPRNIG